MGETNITSTKLNSNRKKADMPAESEGTMRYEDLKASESQVGQIYPVIKDQHGNILDGFHRKRVNPNWKETIIQVDNPLHALRIRVHANIERRKVESEEKESWISETRKILQEQGLKGTQEEIAQALIMTQQWVSKYDLNPTQEQSSKIQQRGIFFGYNVWGFKDESWRDLVVSGDPNQPDKEFYHGSTPAFVIHQLIQMFQPKTVLDSMAGVGTTGYVSRQYEGIECDQFDVYPYEKYNVQQCDAEHVDTGKTYDLIFNHIPYLDMVTYGDSPDDLSTLNVNEFMEKLKRIFIKNHQLLNKDGVFAVLVGDKRFGGKLFPLTVKTTQIGLDCGFKLFDEAIKLTSEQKSSGLQEYRAAEHGYLAQTFDMVLIFKKGD